jgi:hypothetical protein
MGRAPTERTPPFSFLFTAVKRDEAPVLVVPRARGLLVSVDRRAVWNARARVLVAQALLQRYLGGYVWIGDRRDTAGGAYFVSGFTRAIAREILFDGGEIDHADRASEMNLLLFGSTFGDAHEIATARGALGATALDVAIRKASKGERTLRTLVRDLLSAADEAKVDTLPRDVLDAKIRGLAGEDAARDLEAEVTGGKTVPLPTNLLGRCYRLESKMLVPFELGFVTTSDETLTVVSVKPGSRAEAAGLRSGDVAEGLRYEPGHAEVPVTMTLRRGDRSTKVRFTPAGKGRPGRIFERIPGVPDERC